MEDLTSVLIKDLKKSDINLGKILWVTIIEPSFKMSAIIILGKDDTNQIIGISLYNCADN